MCHARYNNQHAARIDRGLCVIGLLKATAGDRDVIVVPTGVGEPPTLLTALSEQRREFWGVQVAQILPIRKFGYFDPETADHVRHTAYFFGGASRAGGQAGWIDFVPAYFSELPTLLDRGLLPADMRFCW